MRPARSDELLPLDETPDTIEGWKRAQMFGRFTERLPPVPRLRTL
jgi:hypothetical protein